MEQPPAGAAGGVSQEGLVLRETTAPQLSPLQSCRWDRCGVENGDTDDPDPVNAEAVCVCVSACFTTRLQWKSFFTTFLRKKLIHGGCCGSVG